jgi:hypothetical protein
MRQEASSRPVRLGVQRQFEANRLSRDFQAQAYEHILPVVARTGTPGKILDQTGGDQVEIQSGTPGKMLDQTGDDRVEIESVLAKGVAA